MHSSVCGISLIILGILSTMLQSRELFVTKDNPSSQKDASKHLKKYEGPSLRTVKNSNFKKRKGLWKSKKNKITASKDRQARFQNHVVGGTEVKPIDSHKWMCDIVTDQLNHVCGCSLITENVALSAAHCKDAGTKIQIGKHYLNQYLNQKAGLNVETFDISEQVVYPGWDIATLHNDVMLVKLDGVSTLDRVKLELNSAAPTAGSPVKVLGWGDTTQGGTLSETLQEAVVNVVDYESCKEDYLQYLTESNFCAAADGKDACTGDSGGPIVKEDDDDGIVQVGIVSFGDGCNAGKPGVYVDIAHKDISAFILDHVCGNEEKGLSALSPSSDLC